MLFVIWYKGLPLSGLISYSQIKSIWEKSGPGYDSGLYDIHRNFSLIINSVSVEDNDRFLCELVVKGNIDPFQNATNVTVFGKREICIITLNVISYYFKDSVSHLQSQNVRLDTNNGM